MSQGIVNTDVLTVKNSYVMGSHSGIQNAGTLYIDGGIYEGYGHGGIYFSGENTVSYVKNATIRACDMPEGYTAVNSAGGTGFYIGGANNISVYMDNNDISGDVYSFTIRDTSNEENNTLYISNSRIGGASSIRIDNTTHTIYNGTGNNFTSSAATLPDAVIDTNVDYSESFPEY